MSCRVRTSFRLKKLDRGEENGWECQRSCRRKNENLDLLRESIYDRVRGKLREQRESEHTQDSDTLVNGAFGDSAAAAAHAFDCVFFFENKRVVGDNKG